MSLSEKFKVVVCPADASKNSKEGAWRALQTQFGRVTSHTELGVNWVGPPSVGQSEPCERLLACCCVGSLNKRIPTRFTLPLQCAPDHQPGHCMRCGMGQFGQKYLFRIQHPRCSPRPASLIWWTDPCTMYCVVIRTCREELKRSGPS